jgi:hypothetical protein
LRGRSGGKIRLKIHPLMSLGRNRLAFVYFQLNCLWNGKLRKTTLQEEIDVFLGKIPFPLEFNASTYLMFCYPIFIQLKITEETVEKP